jgi:hypothetical protein
LKILYSYIFHFDETSSYSEQDYSQYLIYS